MDPLITIAQATTQAEIEAVRALFVRYAAELGVDLSFQSFDTELAELPGDYTPPHGTLFLAADAENYVGCAGVRPLKPGSIAELKRLFVLPSVRGERLGLRLTFSAIEFARDAGYRALRLDTLPSMIAAQAMYLKLGFRDIEPYRVNPIEGSRFMELNLETWKAQS